MGFKRSYFDPLGLLPVEGLRRLFNPYRLSGSVEVNGRQLDVYLTQRAKKALQARSSPMVVELQILFSCVVKKRVVFEYEGNTGVKTADGLLELVCRVTRSNECSPEEFAAGYPVKNELHTEQARNMVPRTLYIDFKGGQWSGEFSIN